MVSAETHDDRVGLLGTVQVLHEHLTASVCQTVFEQTRTTERARKWPLAALAEFWTAVIMRAPQSLPPALEEAAASPGAGWPAVQASPEAFFERCQSLHGRFFAKRYAAFVDHVLPDARLCDAQPLQALRQHFPDIGGVEGSRLDAVAHRLKLLRDVRACGWPGWLTAFYDLSRGITRHLAFDADAAAGERPRTIAALEHVPRGTWRVGDRLYGGGKFFAALRPHGLAGRCRRNGRQSWRWIGDLAPTYVAGGTAYDTLVEIKGTKDLPTQRLRWVRWRKGRDVRALLTNVLEPRELSVPDALCVSPWRWKGERLFFALKEVLNLHRFDTSSPNGVAMPGYAAALVHTAFRVAQGRVAETRGMAPAEIAPAQFFPRLATASIGLMWSELAFVTIQQANPRVRLRKPDWQACACAWTTLARIQVEPRTGRRRKRRFCPSRKHWKSFAHIPGGKN